MGKINRLPPDLANQIAAGEVVERPASVVKELVENAIDAGARRLSIHVELGGKKQVRVEDDGDGMEPEDARLAIERHATQQDPARRRPRRDLDARLPRRGAAVDRVGVAFRPAHARARASRAAPRFASTAARSRRSSRSARAEGTVVEVNDLFYNLPARRKFLKSDGAESAQVSRIVDAAGAGVSGGRLHADQRGPHGAAVSAGGVAARSALSGLRRAQRSGGGPQGGRRAAS